MSHDNPHNGEARSHYHSHGPNTLRLTGSDNDQGGVAIAQRLGIDEVEAEVLTENEEEIVKRRRSEGRVVAIAGDGVNVAPALTLADAGVAIGTGIDVVVEGAGVTPLKGDPQGLVKARALSHATMTNIRQNLFFTFVCIAAGVPVAAGVLYPTFGLLLPRIIAAAAVAFSSVSVIGNALRLRGVKLS